MEVTLKLFATLKPYLPPGAVAHATRVDLPEGADMAGLIGRFGLPEKACHLVLLNGAFVPPPARAALQLTDGDTVSIFPPIGGG